jgi:hypothetical protein
MEVTGLSRRCTGLIELGFKFKKTKMQEIRAMIAFINILRRTSCDRAIKFAPRPKNKIVSVADGKIDATLNGVAISRVCLLDPLSIDAMYILKLVVLDESGEL